MTSYVKHHVHLEKPQFHKLAKGLGVRIAHKHLKGSHEVHLTSRQLAKMGKHHKLGKGIVLKMSPSQLRHNKKYGKGMFGDLLKKGVSYLAPKAVDALGGLAKNFIAKKLGSGVKSVHHKKSGTGFFDTLKTIGSIGLPILKGVLGGKIKKAKKTTKKKKHVGKSFVASGYGV